MANEKMRIDKDPLGPMELDADTLIGPQTARAVQNFPLTGLSIASLNELVVSLAQVKRACALANRRTGELPRNLAEAIAAACIEIERGEHRAALVVDVCQGGAGTSTNMNLNEVIANRAVQLLGGNPGDHALVHPNDHVNRNQSTNDAYASAVRLAVYGLNQSLIAALRRLERAFAERAQAFAGIPKLGRTQLQDAVPMTLGEEFSAFAVTIGEDADRAGEVGRGFLEVNLGGTAIGTGVGSSPAYRDAVIAALADVTGLPVVRAANLVEASWDMGAFVLYSGMLKRIAAKLSKIANDLRLLSSGPAGGIGEIRLPPRQPGSSLMPGKVNPVIPEAINAIAFRVFGHDTTVSFAAEAGQLQLNAFEPVIIWSIHEAATLLTRGIDMLIENCIAGIEADEARCAAMLERSTALATLLVPLIGYARAAAVALLARECGDLRGALAELEPAIAPAFERMLIPEVR